MACSPKREKQLVKDCQSRERAYNRAAKLPRSQLRSKLIKKRRAQLRRAREKLAECRQTQLPRVRRLALELEQHRWSRFVFNSPTGGTARVALQQLYSTGEARCAATGQMVRGDSGTERLLEMLIDLCDVAKGSVLINCILNGSHRAGSSHYDFHAGDIDKSSAVNSNEVAAVCQRHGCNYLNEDAYHWHTSAGSKI